MRIRIFTWMRIRIWIFTLMRIGIPLLLLIKVIQICDHCSTEPPKLHFDPPCLYCERPRLHFEPLKLLNFDFMVDRNPAVQSNAYPFLNLCGSGTATMLRTCLCCVANRDLPVDDKFFNYREASRECYFICLNLLQATEGYRYLKSKSKSLRASIKLSQEGLY